MGTTTESESDTSNEIPNHVKPHIDEHVHRLVLTDEVRDYHGILCSCCSVAIRSGWSYACVPCKFGVHKTCPKLDKTKPCIQLPNSTIFNETQVKISGLKSQQLINQSSYKNCLRCGEKCVGFIKSDCSNGFECHESCSLLPPEIQHPFHNHKLVLGFPRIPSLPHPSSYPSEQCFACRSKLRQFSTDQLCQVYQCTLCPDFYIHIQCAQQMPTLSHSSHEQHPLVLYHIKQDVASHYNDIICKWCGQGWQLPDKASPQATGVYRCVACNFSIHEACIKYQKTIEKDDEHDHKLHYIPPDDYQWDTEHFCEVCGMDTTPKIPVYKCLECPNDFHFHPHCVVLTLPQDEDDPVIQFESFAEEHGRDASFPAALLLLEERISESKGKIECLTLDLEEHIAKLTTLKLTTS